MEVLKVEGVSKSFGGLQVLQGISLTAEAIAFVDRIRKVLGDTALIFCAHDMDLVFNLAERIMVLYYGQIIAQGKPQEIQANPGSGKYTWEVSRRIVKNAGSNRHHNQGESHVLHSSMLWFLVHFMRRMILCEINYWQADVIY
jgi:ABC-type dipeptide/oligopeptide/nickel transport system ATPase component